MVGAIKRLESSQASVLTDHTPQPVSLALDAPVLLDSTTRRTDSGRSLLAHHAPDSELRNLVRGRASSLAFGATTGIFAVPNIMVAAVPGDPPVTSKEAVEQWNQKKVELGGAKRIAEDLIDDAAGGGPVRQRTKGNIDPKTSWVKEQLTTIRDAKGPHAQRAADMLKQIEGLEDDIAALARDAKQLGRWEQQRKVVERNATDIDRRIDRAAARQKALENSARREGLPAAEPPPAKYSSSPSETVSPPKLRGLRLGAQMGAQMVVFWALGRLAAKEDQERFTKLFQDKVEPKLKQNISELGARASRLTADDPTRPVYATVTLEVDYYRQDVGIGGNQLTPETQDMKLVGVELTRDEKNEDKVLHEQKDSSLFSQTTHVFGKKQVTYSIELAFDESKEEHQFRKEVHWAKENASKGITARRSFQMGRAIPLTGINGNEVARRWNEAALTKDERAAAISWAKAYLIATAGKAGQEAIFRDAKLYLDELQRPDDAAARKREEDFLKSL